MFKQDFKRSYVMVQPTERLEIIVKINEGMCSETITGKKQRWWSDKHHPDKEIPKAIYLLGNGTIEELYNEYRKLNMIEWSVFINYTRELIKQKIML